jgi:hypothetical protein
VRQEKAQDEADAFWAPVGVVFVASDVRKKKSKRLVQSDQIKPRDKIWASVVNHAQLRVHNIDYRC